MKNKTITISDGQERFLLGNYKNINQGVQECINKVMLPDESTELLKMIRAYSRNELKGKFSQQEWIFFIDSLNGTMTEGLFRCNSSALAAHCEDSENLDGIASKYDLNVAEIIARVKSLTGAQVDALYSFVDDFWEKPEDLEKYASLLV